MLGVTGVAVGRKIPVAVPRVAIDVAQVKPDDVGSVGVIRELVLHDVGQGQILGQFDGVSVAIGELNPLLGPALAGVQSLVRFGRTTARGRDVSQVHRIGALVDDHGIAEGSGGGGAKEGCGRNDCAQHFDGCEIIDRCDQSVVNL